MRTLQAVLVLPLMLSTFLSTQAADDAAGRSLANSPPFATNFAFVPDKVTAGTPFQFFVDISKATTEPTTVILDFGDGTPVENLDATKKKFATTSHTYAAEGGYTIRITVSHNGFNISTFAPVQVGAGIVVNPTNAAGLSITDANGVSREAGSRFAGGVVNARAFISGGTAFSATTEFDDFPGRQTVVTGLDTSHTYADAGIFIVTTTVSGTSNIFYFGGTGGRVRKTIGVSSRDVGASDAPVDPASREIKVTKTQGKFLFTDSTKTDAVSFTGVIQLPAGFDPARADGNVIQVGAGNVTDTFTVDAKGKLMGPSVKGRVSKAQIKYPKLAGATAVGGELATLSVTYSIADLDILGFDTEGITSSVGSGIESNQKAIRREIQFAILLNGVTYSAKVAVNYKLSKPKKGEFEAPSGQFVQRKF